MTRKNNAKRSGLSVHSRVNLEGFDLASEDSEIERDQNSIEESTANLIPDLSKFNLSPPTTQSSPLTTPQMFNIKPSPVHHHHHTANPKLHSHRHSRTYQDIRNRTLRRQSPPICSVERNQLLQLNLRRSEALRRQLQMIEYELFIISRNIHKLRNE